ncbi:GtrA family protein [Gammaproteobacteria bacterium]|nr:GtrA family protein [Gammaproteobacteria bacterium]
MENFLRFCAIGSFSTLINYAVYIFLSSYELSIFLSSISGYTLGTFVSYHFGRTWVFNRKFESDYYSFVKFIAVYLINGFIVAAITSILSSEIGLDFRLSWVIGIVYGMVANFLGSKFFVFIEK